MIVSIQLMYAFYCTSIALEKPLSYNNREVKISND